MKRIYLLRHAKSSWKEEGLPDHDRPLAGRGRRASKAMARYLRDEGIAPDLVLCSSARRARETLDRIESALGAPTVVVEPDLYGAGAGALLDRLRRVPDSVASVMLIGHNPAMQDLALDLAPGAGELAEKYPTGGLATLTFAGATWAELDRGGAEFVALVKPRDLE